MDRYGRRADRQQASHTGDQLPHDLAGLGAQSHAHANLRVRAATTLVSS